MPGSTERLINNLSACGYFNLAAVVRNQDSSELIKEGAFGHLSVRVVIRDLSDYGRQLFEESVINRPLIRLPCEHLKVKFGEMEVQSDNDTRFKENMREEYNRLYRLYIQRIQHDYF